MTLNKSIAIEIKDKFGLASKDFFTLYVFYHVVDFFLDKITEVVFKNEQERNAVYQDAMRLWRTLANQLPIGYRDKFKVDLIGTIQERK